MRTIVPLATRKAAVCCTAIPENNTSRLPPATGLLRRLRVGYDRNGDTRSRIEANAKNAAKPASRRRLNFA